MITLPYTPLPRKEWIACCRPCGRRGLPPELVAAMHADYMLLGSLRQSAAVWGISNQAFHAILRRRGLQRPKKRNPFIAFQGEKFAIEHQGYYRSTRYSTRRTGAHRLLHRVVWEHYNGPIPAGHIVAFRDANRANCDPENLLCIPKSQTHTLRKTHTNGFTAYDKKVAPLLDAYLTAIREHWDLAEIAAARAAYESIPRPTNGDPEVRRAKCQATWDAYTPEQRAARIAKTAAARHINRSKTTTKTT